MSNCFLHSEFVRLKASESLERSLDGAAPEKEEDDMAFVGLLPPEVQRSHHVAIDDSGVVASQLTDDERSSALPSMGHEVPDEEDLCDVLRLLQCTVKKSCGRSRRSRRVSRRCCWKGLSHVCKLILSAQLSAKKKKKKKHYGLFYLVSIRNKIIKTVHFCYSFDGRIIRTFFFTPLRSELMRF